MELFCCFTVEPACFCRSGGYSVSGGFLIFVNMGENYISRFRRILVNHNDFS